MKNYIGNIEKVKEKIEDDDKIVYYSEFRNGYGKVQYFMKGDHNGMETYGSRK